MANELVSVINQIVKDKGIERQLIVQAIESAVLSAAKRHFGHGRNLESKFNEESGEVEIIEFKIVVDEVEDSDTQISLADARREFDSEAMVGDELGRKLNTDGLGRIAAQTAKQVIMQKVRDAERGAIFEEYKGSKGEIISGIVQRYDRGNLIVNLGRTEAILPQREQIAKERYRQGDRVRGMILDIDPTARGPQIIITRSHPEFLRKLFTAEVPEIQEGVIEIKAIAREPGERAKIAVHSNDSSLDPVGACVGVKGSRVQAVVQELRGERIDIVTWTADEPSFVARSLSLTPAQVSRVVLDDTNHSIEVVVPDDQLSLAIGRRGQNVKLASKLTGWRIDVRSVTMAEEEAKRARASIETIPGIDFAEAERIYQAGFRSIKEVAAVTVDELMESIDGMTAEHAAKILADAQAEYEKQLEDRGNSEPEVDAVASDIHLLVIGPELREKLVKGGLLTIQRLTELSDDELLAQAGIDENQLSVVKDALDTFLKTAPVYAGRRGRERS
ncbi:MAG TPA: transcription termination factor NusA [Oligoflexia bacterium]|nr:transcription termination factor NusA [Oligoflexia bacterium]HMP27804.1 transcription termination factor NusA [Oligoflexia bacterium]